MAELGVFVLPLLLAVSWIIPGQTLATRRRAVLAGCLAAVVAIGVGMVLERVLGRPRPFVELGFAPLIAHMADSSFPSDHMLFGGIGMFVWALLVGVARIAAGLHYPSDIIGTAVLALGIDVATMRVATVVLRGRLP